VEFVLGPIFVREWLTLPRRPKHYMVRAAYIGLLWIVGLTTWQVTVGWNQTATLSDNARFGLLLFQIFTVVQLGLLPFLAGLSAASAISQEKDRRTFILLLMTDLRSYEIVLGKLLGSLLQIALLLVGMIPVLALMTLLGGVSPEQVVQAGLILAVTALTAGAVGNLVALWREKTFQSLALTVLFLVLYVCLVRAVPAVVGLVPGADYAGQIAEHSQKWLDPMQALETVLQPATDTTQRIAPAYLYATVMVGLSVLLCAWGILRLRVWNPSGEPIMQRERPEDLDEKDRLKAHAAPGAVRTVWANPILWREMRTRAYGRRPLMVKAAYALVLALICYYALAPLFGSAGRNLAAGQGIIPFAAKGLVPVTILSLLLVSAQSVTALTSERDTGALDLLLVTDLTPQEFIFGKVGGILWNAKEYLLPPFLLAAVYAWYGYLATPPALHPDLLAYMNGESLVCVLGATLVLLTFALVLGVHVALRTENSRLAVINTLSTTFFLSVGTLVCIFLIGINTRFEYQWASFMLFIAAGIGGLWWVLSGDRPSAALTVASWACPLGVFYTVTNILVARPGSQESADPLMPFLVTSGAFSFAVAAMLIPLLSEFDVALGRTSGGGE
jgi:ABC-type transport system involved in multi-copper enzyme maturation permease subunit